MADVSLVEPEIDPEGPPQIEGGDQLAIIGQAISRQKNLRRTRRRRRNRDINDEVIVQRVIDHYNQDISERPLDIAQRLQRRAKKRMWSEGTDLPWPDASDVALPDIATASYRMQDTLYNSVLAQTPPLTAKSQNPANAEREDKVTKLLTSQFFLDQNGEEIIGDATEEFVDEGVVTAFIPWVKEKRQVHDVQIFDPIPPDVSPFDYFRSILVRLYPRHSAVPFLNRKGLEGWEWRLFPNQTGQEDDAEPAAMFEASFYTTKRGKVELVTDRETLVYEGPRILIQDYEDVLYPTGAANLQIPGPSNPKGATHVILRSHPTVDEIRRLAKEGVYDLVDQDTLDSMPDVAVEHKQDRDMADQNKLLAGLEESMKPIEGAAEHGTLTRLMCFDMMDVNGDGKDEDVIFWVILETKTLLRWAYLTEVYPGDKPLRPLVSKSFFPVKGMVAGVGLTESMEGLHDAMKAILDQEIDAQALATSPWGLYRSTGSFKQETIRMAPGDLYPSADPKNDIHFPEIKRDSAANLNMFNTLQQQEEKLTMVGDLQLGRVPTGRSSALRTIGGIALLSGQGEARPERILRRFFNFWGEVWMHMHRLNQQFIPRNKVIRILGTRPTDDPYLTVESRSQISGAFDFVFSANIFNASRQAMQENIEALLSVYLTPLAFQIGAIDAAGAYRLMRDYGEARGQSPDLYIREPSPGARKRPIFAEEVLQTILSSQTPDGRPAEAGGAQEHLQKLQQFAQGEDAKQMTPAQIKLFQTWLQIIQGLAQGEQEQQQQEAAAGQFQQGQQQGGVGGAPTTTGPSQNPNTPPQIQGTQLFDQTLPSERGGVE